MGLSVWSGCSEKAVEDTGPGTGDCQGDSCAANAPAIDWKAAKPTYTAHVRVVNGAGDPVKDATVKVGTMTAKTDKDGRANVGPLDAAVVSTVEVNKEGTTPQVSKASAWNSSRTTETVTVSPVGVEKMIDAKQHVVADTGGAQVDLPPSSLSTADGQRASMAKMQLTYLSGDESKDVLPGDGSAVDEFGAPTGISKLGGVLYLHFEDEAKRPLNLAPGQTAMLEMPLATGIDAKDGDSIPLWSLDTVLGQWRKESTCQVITRTVAGATERVCRGPVDHFSFWAYGSEIDIYKPGTVGCLNITAAAEQNACFKVSVHSLSTYRCDAMGANCRLTDFVRERYLKPTMGDVAWCGVLEADTSTYRVVTVYDTDTSGCAEGEAMAAVESGRRSKVSEPLNLASFKDMLGSELMLNFTLNGDRDCPTLCGQVPVTITQKDIESAPWTDRDNDGAYTSTDANLKPPFPVDCNDDRSDIYPNAPEPFCVLEDRNCDKAVNKAYKTHADVAAGYWNWQCHACKLIPDVNLPLVEEVKMNRYDEDCDGVVSDYDGDGHDYPADCDDSEKTAFPGATEKVGNYIDEDCDGAALDADGDGVYNPYHIYLAEKLKKPLTDFTDCDDYDARVSPKNPPTAEAGALARYFYMRDGAVRRSALYCSMFDQDGSPSWLYYNYARDLNCDGYVSDVDGDGFTVAGDRSLGEGLDIDCDDTDPRNRPTSMAEPTCVVRNDWLNDSVCTVQSRAGGEGCPVLTLAGTDVVTECEEGVDAEGNPTGIGVCNFKGSLGGNPLVVNPESAWGPCDSNFPDSALPCPAGNTCAGVLPYTDAFTEYLESTYLDGMPQGFLGMCFPGCEL